MYTKITTAAIAASFLAEQVIAVGNAIVKNQCGQPVYLWTVSNTPGVMNTVAPGGVFTEPYQTNPNGGGVSIKIATEPDQAGAITQYEYTLDATLWYDISNINGYPFMAGGLTLVPSDPSCRSVACPAGQAVCSAAYNLPDDNWATAACGTGADTVVTLCSDNAAAPAANPVDNVNVNVPVADPAPAPAPTPTPTPEPAPAPAPAPAPSSSSTSTSIYTPPPPPPTTTTPTTTAPPTPDPNVATTFATEVVTEMVVETLINFAHIPVSLGADWAAPKKNPRDQKQHKRATLAHRHHYHQHA